MSNPFLAAPSQPGTGTIHLALLPPATPRLKTVKYQYPLKLVTPSPLRTGTGEDCLVHTVYLLTYGGGLVTGDAIDLRVVLDETTRLVLLTQGSTKIFKTPNREILSRQKLTVILAPNSALCYLPDPVQPFESSSFEQQQTYSINMPHSPDLQMGSLCVLDWVSNGRPANGENWSFYHYASRNDLYLCQAEGQRKLLLRDNLLLNDQAFGGSVAQRMTGLAIYGTLLLYGPLIKSIGGFFMNEFKLLPRIGGRKWDTSSESGEEDDPLLVWREERQRLEKAESLLWSVADVRGCVVVKFGAPALEVARKWLLSMLTQEQTVVKLFGERALLCLK